MSLVPYMKYFWFPLDKEPLKPSNANYVPLPSKEEALARHTVCDIKNHSEYSYFSNRFGEDYAVYPSWYNVLLAAKLGVTDTDVGLSITPGYTMHWTYWAENTEEGWRRPWGPLTNRVVFRDNEINTRLVISKSTYGMTQITPPNGDFRISAALYIPGVLQWRNTSGEVISDPLLYGQVYHYLRVGLRWMIDELTLTDEDRSRLLHKNTGTGTFKCLEPELYNVPILKRVQCSQDWAYLNGFEDKPYSYQS